MTIKASGRSALILAAGLFVCLAGPSQAATARTMRPRFEIRKRAGAPIALSKYTKHASHHSKELRAPQTPASRRRNRRRQESRRRRRRADDSNGRCRDPAIGRQRQCATGRPPIRRPATPRRCPRGPTIFVQAAPDNPADASQHRDPGGRRRSAQRRRSRAARATRQLARLAAASAELAAPRPQRQ